MEGPGLPLSLERISQQICSRGGVLTQMTLSSKALPSISTWTSLVSGNPAALCYKCRGEPGNEAIESLYMIHIVDVAVHCILMSHPFCSVPTLSTLQIVKYRLSLRITQRMHLR